MIDVRAWRRLRTLRLAAGLAAGLLAAAGCAPGAGGHTTATSKITVVRAGDGGGTVTSTPAGIDCGTTCAAAFDDGHEVTLDAAPDGSSVLSGWQGCDHQSGYSCMVALTTDRTVTATFAPKPTTATLTVQLVGDGGGTVDDGQGFTCTGGTCTHDYAVGTSVTLTATPDGTSAFGAFAGCDGGTGDTCTVTLDAPATVTATFDAVPTDITGLTVTPALQSLHLAWTNPQVASFDHARVYLTGPGQAGAGQDVTVASVDAAGLVPGASYRVKVTAVDASGVESTGANLDVTTHCTGAAADFTAGQSAATLASGQVFLAWTGATTGNLYLGESAPLAGDELWLAVDTDPDAGDATGKANFAQGAGEILWPFKADAVVALTESGNARLWLASDPTTVDGNGNPVHKWTSLAVVDGVGGAAVTEWGVNLSALGLDGTTHARFALVTLEPTTGKSRDLSPASQTATDVTGLSTSPTSGFQATPFDLAGLGTSLATPVDAPSLVTFTVTDPGATGPVQLLGSRPPLTPTLPAGYQLATGSTAGTYTGTFNLGGASGDVYFRFTDAGTPETLGGAPVLRVHGLSGASESVPAVTFGQSFDGQHPFTVDFVFTDDGTQGTPVELRGRRPRARAAGPPAPGPR